MRASTLILVAILALLALPARAQGLPEVIRFGGFGQGFGQPYGVALLAIAQVKGFIADEFAGTPVRLSFEYFTGTGPAINEAIANGRLDFAQYGGLPNIIGKAEACRRGDRHEHPPVPARSGHHRRLLPVVRCRPAGARFRHDHRHGDVRSGLSGGDPTRGARPRRAADWLGREENREAVFAIWSKSGVPVAALREEHEGLALRDLYNPRLDAFLLAQYRDGIAFSREER